MATQTITASINADAIASGAWRSNDTLTINNGAVVTVNTTQNKFWSGVTGNNGKLRIENNSTTVPLIFRMGRASGTTAPAITPASGLFSIEIDGDWIEIGTGDGTAGQAFTLPYRDHVAGIWVETASGSGIYERWANCLSGIRAGGERYLDGFAGFGSGVKGTVFKQGINASPVYHTVQTNCTTSTASRNVTVTSTAGIFPGAQIIGSAGIPASSVVERVIDATTLEMNVLGSANSSTVTATIYNTFECWTTDQITVGDGTHGNVVPVGAKVRVPNILITASFGINLGTASSGVNINLAAGGNLIANTCLFAAVNSTFTTPQTLSLSNCAFSFPHNINKAYGIVLNNLIFSVPPQYPFLVANRFSYGYAAYVGSSTSVINWTYITGSISGITAYSNSMPSSGSQATAAGLIGIGYADELVVNDVTGVMGGTTTAGAAALALQYVYRSTITNVQAHGLLPINLYAASGNTIDGVNFSLVARDDYVSPVVVSNAENFLGIDPTTGQKFVDGTAYFFNLASKHTNLSEAIEPWFGSKEICFAPCHSSNLGFFNLVGFYPGNNQVVIVWDDRRPTHNAPAFEIYRSTTAGVPVRDAGTRIYTTNTNTVVTYTDSTAVNGTRYYYVLRKYYSAGVYEDTPVWDVTPQANTVANNYLLQSKSFNNAQWTKSNVSAATSADIPGITVMPLQFHPSTRRINVTAANGTLTNVVTGLTIGLTYTASAWVCFQGTANNAIAAVTTTPMRLTFGTAFVDFNATGTWTQQSVSFVATATSHNFVLQFNTNGNWVDLDNCMVNLGASVGPGIETGATAVTTSTLDPISVKARCCPHSMTENAGVSVLTPTLAYGSFRMFNAHISTTKGFTPSVNTVAMLGMAQQYIIRLSTTSSDNKIRNITQQGKGSYNVNLIQLTASCNDNIFENIQLDRGLAGYGSTAQVVSISTSSNRNAFKNISVANNIPNEATTRPFITTNDSDGTLVQNFRVEPGNTYIEPLNSNMIIKGCGGGNMAWADTLTYNSLGSGQDSVPITFTGVYDTHFAELYHSATTGALNVFFTASTSDNPPYVLTGTAAFSNTGYLYLQSSGDSITYTWPHKIFGVSGFRNIAHMVYQSDLANNNTGGAGRDQLQALLVEYQIDTGSGYSAWEEATPANLSALSLSASAGFNLKLRLTARQFLVYLNQTNEFVVGETIRQLTSGATARVTAVYDNGSSGIICVDTVTGTWSTTASLDIVRDSDSQARCGDIQLINSFVFGPSFTSHIRGLQIHTTVDQTVMYPTDTNTITFTGLPTGCDIVILAAGTGTILDQKDSNAGSSYTWTYSGAQNVDVGFIKGGYVPYYIRNLALTTADTSIPVALSADRNYQ